MDSPKKSQWILPLSLLALTSLLIVAGLIYNRFHPILEPLNPSASPSPLVSDMPSGSPLTSPLPGPSAEASPQALASPSVPEAPMPVDLTVDTNGLSKATVILTTSQGVIKFKFYSNDAPETVKRLVELIQSGFYNGLSFHRVIPGFVIQGGDPRGDGTGGSGQRLKAEFNNRKHVEGALAMARAADPDSADSQFYISLGTHPHLDRSYTVFGQVIEGMDVARKIRVGDRMITVTIE